LPELSSYPEDAKGEFSTGTGAEQDDADNEDGDPVQS
jgi:hypothetical protein